ncbi:hypothetical protein E1264_01220 [Actinomadura sp. KC216]|uniref:hypothetical protein n=1 Tax=Actinomadura sp. KC216 TaxID=2530370 RepID=UPI00104455A6|nr:hypothetical protein [Actinomadura sp. KC216]TDB91601.1 hypothetical protein E1264_01220 [Actinomadura sp. KC216]
MGVDHTSGTETTDQPQPSSETPQPPPDRPGTPGRPSRQESWTAASTPTETAPQDSDETTDDKPSAETPEPEAAPDRETPGTPRADSWTRARETQQADTDEPRTEDARAPAEPEAEQPAPGRGPRAESWARAAEPQSTPDTGTSETDAPDRPDGQEAQTGEQDTPAQESRPENDDRTDDSEPLLPDRDHATEDGDEPIPGTAEPGEPRTEQRPETEAPSEPGREPAEGTAPGAERAPDSGRQATDHDDPRPSPEDAERPDEIADGPGNGRGRNSENQPASPASEETETDPFAGLPTRADLDPASAGELTAERGEPLAPVNENQDWREPEPERDSREKRLFRGLNDDLEEALKNASKFSQNAQDAFKDNPPPSDRSTSTGFNRDEFHPATNTVDYPDVITGAVATVMFGIGLFHGLRKGAEAIKRRNDDRD